MSAVDRLLSGQYQSDDRAAIVGELVTINGTVQRLIAAGAEDNDDREWEKVFDEIFSDRISRRVFKLFGKLERHFDYYDPDTTYEEDSRAFATSLNDAVRRIS